MGKGTGETAPGCVFVFPSEWIDRLVVRGEETQASRHEFSPSRPRIVARGSGKKADARKGEYAARKSRESARRTGPELPRRRPRRTPQGIGSGAREPPRRRPRRTPPLGTRRTQPLRCGTRRPRRRPRRRAKDTIE